MPTLFTATTFTTAIAALAAVSMTSSASLAQDATIVELTQTACQFVEAEGKDHGFKSTRKADCEAINAKTAEERLKTARVMTLKPGKHVFRVTNKNVPYGLGLLPARRRDRPPHTAERCPAAAWSRVFPRIIRSISSRARIIFPAR